MKSSKPGPARVLYTKLDRAVLCGPAGFQSGTPRARFLPALLPPGMDNKVMT
jgi:hypothetical protein